MKIFFDTNVYVAEALLGKAARRMLDATRRARWRVYTSQYVTDEVAHVLVDYLGFDPGLARIVQRRILRRSTLVRVRSNAKVIEDPKDTPVLAAALSCGADCLVTNDRHFLKLNPFEGLHIISMDDYYSLLKTEGLIR